MSKNGVAGFILKSSQGILATSGPFRTSSEGSPEREIMSFRFHKWQRPHLNTKVRLYKSGKFVSQEGMHDPHPYSKQEPDVAGFFSAFQKRAGKRGSGYDEVRLYEGGSLLKVHKSEKKDKR